MRASRLACALVLVLAAIAPPVAADAAPTADFHWQPDPGCVGESTRFISDSEAAPGTSLVWARIDFGDGDSVAGAYQPTIDHTYASTGTYVV